MRSLWKRAARLAVLALLLPLCAAAQEPLTTGAGSFVYEFTQGGEKKSVTVWYYRPEGLGRAPRVVIVQHGAARNGETYREAWIPLAEQYRFLLVVPEFSREQFPGSRLYNLGNVFARDGARNPPEEWTYGALERIFDEVRARAGISTERYGLYGHSAGSQFAHRFLLFHPEARADTIICANAGWYTMPAFEAEFPYGLDGSGLTEADLRAFLARPVVVLLGDQDTDPNHSQLNRSPQALLQGPHRFARGHKFFETAREQARRLGVPFRWRLEIVPGVAHSNARMAPAAARFLAGEAQ